jgi:hypothetical protein
VADRLLDVDRARVTHTSDGAVVFDDGGPWVVRVWHRIGPRGRYVARLRVDVRDPGIGVTATRLARLPTSQMLALALSTVPGRSAHPNESYYSMLALPKTGRHWDDGHWERVLEVFEWAVATRRPGGGAMAVAEKWGVAVNPTVHRWLAEARRRRAAANPG